jgi:hypothetical protein
MARIKYTGLIESINGSVDGTTFQRNAYGHTIKKKPNMVNPNRSKQQLNKGNLQYCAQQWAALTDPQRAAWVAYATAYPVPSRLNPAAYLSGHAVWLRTSLLRLLATYNVATDIIDPTQAALTPSFEGVTRSGAELNFVDTSGAPGGDYIVMFFASFPVKVTQLYDRSRTRYLGFLIMGMVDTIDLAAPYSSQFGILPETGDYIFTKVVYLNMNNGQVYTAPPVNTLVN